MKGASSRLSCRRRSSRSCRSPRRREPASAWGWGRGGLGAGAMGSAFAQPHCWVQNGAALSRPRCLARVRGQPYAPGSPQGADAAGGGVAAEPEAEGCLRGAGGAAEPQPGRAENLAGKRGARGWWLPAAGCGGSRTQAFVGRHGRSIALQTLSLQRQMMENLVIAKAREETVSLLLGESSEQGLGAVTGCGV